MRKLNISGLEEIVTLEKNEYKGENNIEEIIVSCEEIPLCAFRGCKNLKKVTFTDNVKVIGTQAFYGCENLETVVMSKSIETIGALAFTYCKKLKDIDTSNVKNFKELCFLDSGIEEISLQNAEEIKELAFSKTKIQEIIIPENLERVNNRAFEDCENLKKIYIRNSIVKPDFKKDIFCNVIGKYIWGNKNTEIWVLNQ